jgi:hypothetical protein
VFPAPADLGATATIVVGMMSEQIKETKGAHTETTRIYCTYHTVDQAFKKLIIDSFEDPFLNALSDEVVGYANCT